MTEPRTRLTLAELLAGLAPVAGHSDTPVRSLALDCRQIDTDDVFVALAGQTAHGLDYLEQALERGAVAVLHDGKGQPPESCSVPVIAIDHLSEHLPELARRLWGDPAATMELIAVTGTNGKSSVAWLLAQALDGAMIGTLGIGRPGQHQPGSHTTPDLLSLYRALARLRDAGIKQVVIEASSHALDQQRLAGLAFSSVIFTTLGHDHLDYHPDRKAYGAAKARLFSDYPSQRQIINVDDDFGAEAGRRSFRVTGADHHFRGRYRVGRPERETGVGYSGRTALHAQTGPIARWRHSRRCWGGSICTTWRSWRPNLPPADARMLKSQTSSPR